MKKIIKCLLFILTILLTILLSMDIVIFTIRKLSEDYISKESISNIIDNIDINQLLKQDGKELKEIKIIKEKLAETGIPEELIADFISSVPIKETASNATNMVIDSVFYGKEIEYEINENEVYSFFENNLPVISKELQEKNIPKSEYLTQERQDKILEKIKEETPVIKQNVNEIMKEVENKLQNNAHQDKLNEVLKITRMIYSERATILLFSIFIVCIIFICLTRRSISKSFKWIGFAYLISSISLYAMSLLVPILQEKMNEIPDLFMNIIIPMLNKLVQSLQQFSLNYIMVAFGLIIINIIIHIVKEKKKEKIKNL